MESSSSKRIVWIDWAKTIGIMIVVFCHVPQYNTLEKLFLCSFQMPLFFFLSGYLHKVPVEWKSAIRKYWKTLIIPYILFQFIFYPYSLVQRTMQEGLVLSDIKESVIKPFLLCLWGVPIDGITWFLFALLLMKIIADFCYRSRYSNFFVIMVCIGSIIMSCIFHADDVTNITFAIDSLFDFLPFFFLGYYVKIRDKKGLSSKLPSGRNRWNYIIYGLLLAVISLFIIKFVPSLFFVQRISFYVLGIIGAFFIINLCKVIPSNNRIVLTISKGTIILLGLHWMFIGSTNFFIEKTFHLNTIPIYNTIEAVLLVFAITAVNYFIILFCEKHFKIILGGR